MKKDYLELNDCINSGRGFEVGREYIILGTDETFTHGKQGAKKKCYKVINKDGAIETVIYEDFFKSQNNRIIKPIKSVVYIGIGDMDFLEEGSVYSVFNIIDNGELVFYEVFDEANKLVQYPKEFFLSENKYADVEKEAYEEIKKTRLKTYNNLKPLIFNYNEAEKKRQEVQEQIEKENKIKKAEAIKLKKENDIKAKEAEKQQKEADKREKKKIESVINAFMSNVKRDNTPYILKEVENLIKGIKSTSANFKIYCVIMIIASFFINSLTTSIISAICLFAGWAVIFLMNKNIFTPLNKELLKYSKQDTEYIELLSSFSDDVLLKIKKVEVGLLVLESRETISSGVVSLIRETVSFCLESYKANNEELACDIEAFLDKTLEYINSLKEDSDIEALNIEKRIYENISSVINRNIQVYESMISDNKEIRKILDSSWS